ncbi:MAG: hypothetical protein E6R00_04380 [Gammaproteobacteria bacterium]|nr:MAG: hypothetical protein E6R00_04380 [Gammaproteobacteria bacterium]
MAGRPEILTEELARKIAKMIELFTDSEIPVTWENVIAHSKKRFGHGFNRQMLGQKEWNGRKIIAEAFSEAKTVQRRMQNDARPKYRNAQRSVLHKRIAELEAKVIALKEELEKVRAQQIDELDAFLNTPRDLRQMFERFCTSSIEVDELMQKRNAQKQAVKSTPVNDHH